jgi:hypothetical protein
MLLHLNTGVKLTYDTTHTLLAILQCSLGFHIMARCLYLRRHCLGGGVVRRHVQTSSFQLRRRLCSKGHGFCHRICAVVSSFHRSGHPCLTVSGSTVTDGGMRP